MKKNILLIMIGFTSFFAVVAQNPVFSKSTITYSPIVSSTRHMKDSVWDDPTSWKPAEQQIPLGFTFKAFGKSINTFLWEQGAIFFRDIDTVIHIGLVADLCDYGYGSKVAKSPLFYKKEGSAGNYIMKLEWRGFGFWDEWDDAGSCKDSASLQIWIYQNPQKVEMRFGTRNVSKFGNWFASRLPLRCARYDVSGNTAGMVLHGDPANPTTHAFADTGTRGLTSWPAVGQMYTFTFSLIDAVHELSLNFESEAFINQGLVNNMNCKNGTEVFIYGTEGRMQAKTIVQDGKAKLPEMKQGLYYVIWTDGIQLKKLKYLNVE